MLEVLVKKAPTIRFTQDNKTPLAEIEAEFDSLRADAPPRRRHVRRRPAAHRHPLRDGATPAE